MPAKFPGTISIDNREKKEYKFNKVRADKYEGGGLVDVPWEIGYLVTGDYSVKHHEWRVAVERKSKVDLYGTLGKGIDRFERELERLNDMDYALILVESELSDVLGNPPKYTRRDPKTIYRKILAYQFRFPRVHWLFVPGREFAEATVFRYLQRYLMEYEKGNK